MLARRILAALFFALLGSAVFTFWLSKKVSKPQAAAPSHLHYVAMAQTVEAGQALNAGNLKLVEWPASNPLPGAFAKPEELVGRTILYPLALDEPILNQHLAAPGAGAGLSTRIPDGMRAISLKSDQIVGVAGFLLPGTHVDVLVTYRPQNQGDPITNIVLQDVQILAAGQKIQPDPEGKATTTDVVTLLVKPLDAEKVVLASAQGSVHFVLRNGSDHDVIAENASFFGRAMPATSRAPAVGAIRSVPARSLAVLNTPKTYAVHTISGSGGKEKVETFQ